MTVDVKKVLFTTFACFLLAASAFTLDSKDQATLYSPFLFTTVTILTALDRLRVNKLKAVGLGLMLTLPVFFVSVLAGVGLTQILRHAHAGLVVSSAMSAGLMFLVSSLYFSIERFKTGLAITAVLGFSVPFVIQLVELCLPGTKSPAGFVEDPGLFFICWQTFVGLGISIGVWGRAGQGKHTSA